MRTIFAASLARAALALGAAQAGCHRGSEAAAERPASDAPDAATPEAAPREHTAHEDKREFPPAGPSIAVRFEGKSVDLRLASMAPDGGEVPLASLWKAAWPSEDTSRLSFELVGSDGFRPTSRAKCTHLLTAGEFAHGRMDAATHDVTYPEEPDLPGCYRVHHVVAIEATRE
jgi:hypothetical protein